MLSYCSMTTKVEFGEKLQKLMDEAGIIPAELSKRSGVDKTIISRALNGERMPKAETLSMLAEGIGIPAIELFEAAGIMQPIQGANELQSRLDYLFNQLPPNEQERLVEYARFMVATVEKEAGRSTSKK